MKKTKVRLIPLTEDDREQFILDNQWAFKYGAMMEFGKRDDHIDDDGEIISRSTIERCIDTPGNETYRIVLEDRRVGGLILKIDKETHKNELEILFVSPEEHTKGIGYGAWCEVEALHPETVVWETCTPYFEKRNIHFYVNKCGFKIDEFQCEHFKAKNDVSSDGEDDFEEGPGEMFHFVKIMKS
ncbi:MAG: GNAT family N-acetyltransferase [Clostridia bacterium]|nr:GNAT family N-acetyltransferase [Clostridia bacterium]